MCYPTFKLGNVKCRILYFVTDNTSVRYWGSPDTLSGTNCCPETSSRRYHPTLHKLPESRRPQPNPDGLFRIQTLSDHQISHTTSLYIVLSISFSLYRSLW